nr:acyltransferase [Pseudomonas sp.]
MPVVEGLHTKTFIWLFFCDFVSETPTRLFVVSMMNVTRSTSTLASQNLPWNPRLAHLRFIAALLVLAFHTYHSFFGMWQPRFHTAGFGWVVEGHTGVSLFFVLSGYLFMSIALRSQGQMNYASFLRNRVLRVFPLFVVVFIVAVSVAREAFQPQDVLYLFFSNLGQAPTSKLFMTGPAWTISVEFTFYLIFPFLARFAVQQGPGYLVRLIFLVLLFKTGAFLASESPTHMIYSTLLGRLDQFLIGMLAAQLAASWASRPLHGAWTLAAGFVMWALLEAQARWASYFLPDPVQLAWLGWPTIEAMGWAAVIVTYAHWRGAIWGWLGNWMERGGEISFSLYLWHALVIYLVTELFGTPAWFGNWQLNAIAIGTVILTVTWGISAISYRTIEEPFLGLRKRYTQQAPRT